MRLLRQSPSYLTSDRIPPLPRPNQLLRWPPLTLVSLLLAMSCFAEDSLPLTPERSVKFETSEVTWLSLDVSPDGERLVLEAVGHLYTMDINGGVANQITDGMSFNSTPAWSPDGEWIAFVSDRRGQEELWITNPDGSETRRLSTGSFNSELTSPTWAPDSSHVVVAETTWPQRVYALKAYHLDGGSGVSVTAVASSDMPNNDRWNATGPKYSPDGKFVFYAGKYGGFGYDLRFPLWQIYRLELKSGETDQVTSAVGSAFRPELSPDGRLLVYGTRHGTDTQLRIRNLESGAESVLASSVIRDEQESRFTRDLLPGFTFTPDGKRLIFTSDGKVRSLDLETRDLTEISFSLTVDRGLGPRLYFPYRMGFGPVKARLARDVAVSPDGSSAAFSALGKLHRVDLDTGSVEPIGKIEEYAAQPTWSVDGRHIAYVTWSFDGGHVWTMRANGRGKPRRITDVAAFYSQPLWFGDNKQIIVVRASAQQRIYAGSDWGQHTGSDLIALPIGGGEPKPIRPARGLTAPHLGPDPQRIYLYHSPFVFGGSDSAIVSIRLDGTDLQRHFSAKGAGIYYSQDPVASPAARLSPTGGHALAISANQLFLFRLFHTQFPHIDANVSNAPVPVVRLTDVGADQFGFTRDGKHVHWTAGSTLHVRPISEIRFREETDTDGADDSAEAGDDNEIETSEGSDDSIAETDEKSEPDASAEGEDSAESAVAASAGDASAEEQLLEEHESVRTHELTVYRARYAPKGTLVLAGATLIPVTGDEAEAVENATIVVKNDRVDLITTGEYVPGPDAEVMDVSGLFVVPGYVDTHAHFSIHRNVLGTQSASLMANLAYGITTGIDVQPSTVDVLDYQDLVDAGAMVGTRPLSTGPGVFSDNSFESRRHAHAILERYKNNYRVHNLKAYISGGRKQRQWMVEASKELKLMPTTEGGLDFKGGITHAIDGFSGHEHNFPSTDLRRDVVELVARSGLAYTPTLLVNYGGPSGESWYFTLESPYDDAKLRRYTPPQLLESRALRRNWFHPSQYVFSQLAAQAHKLVDAGGKVGVGSHGQLQGLGFHWELWSIHSGDFTNFEALRAATRHGAEMIGIAQDVGSIEEGKLADMVVLTANPLEDIRATASIRHVIQGGVVRDGETLEELWPIERPAPELHWGISEPN